MEDYFQKIEMEQILVQEREDLNNPVTNEELLEAIISMKLGKAPGPDGFTLKFYRTFQKELIPKFQKLANDIFEGELPPKTWQEANMSLIPKTEDEIPNAKDFRPISLLNT